jgi:hypothetical protein
MMVSKFVVMEPFSLLHLCMEAYIGNDQKYWTQMCHAEIYVRWECQCACCVCLRYVIAAGRAIATRTPPPCVPHGILSGHQISFVSN